MKTITVDKDSKVAAVIKELQERKQEFREEWLAKQPPAEIKQYIAQCTEKTAIVNGDGFSKESFRLGMYVMWFHLKQQNKIV